MVLVQVDADIIGRKECGSYRGRLDGIWPVRAMERGREDKACAGANGN